MAAVIIAIGIIIILAILLLIYRIYTLVSVVRGTEKIRVSKSNKINATLFILFLLIFGGWFFYYSFDRIESYTVPLASVNGVEYEKLFWATTWVTLAVFVITQALLFIFSFKYQYNENRKATFYPDNTKLEVIWTILPAIALATLIFSGFKVWSDITGEAPEEAETIEVFGYQFSWLVRYPGADNELGAFDYREINPVNEVGLDLSDKSAYDDFIINELRVPKGRPVELKIRARDVLHSVFLPFFRQKMDAMPGMPTRMWFVPTKTTEEIRQELKDPEYDYELYCTEVCGRGHFSMKIRVIVMEPDDYEKWYAEQQSFLKQNPDLLSKVPQENKEVAIMKAGIEADALKVEGVELTKN